MHSWAWSVLVGFLASLHDISAANFSTFHRCSNRTYPRTLGRKVMALVSYSDSEESGDEELQKSSKQNGSALGSAQPTANFAVDRTNPRKIRVNLQETKADPLSNVGAPDGEPSPKRQRTGGGAF